MKTSNLFKLQTLVINSREQMPDLEFEWMHALSQEHMQNLTLPYLARISKLTNTYNDSECKMIMIHYEIVDTSLNSQETEVTDFWDSDASSI